MTKKKSYIPDDYIDDKEIYDLSNEILSFLAKKNLSSDLVVNALASSFLTAAISIRLDPAMFKLQLDSIFEMHKKGIEDWLRDFE